MEDVCMYVILLNGPPGSGKDTIGYELCYTLESLGYVSDMHKFASPIKDALTSFFDLEPYVIEEDRDINIPDTDVTYRKALISLSQNWAKPLFGDDIFAKIAAGLVCRYYSINDFIIITDCGFLEEATSFMANLKCRGMLVRIHREGTSYEGDSRSYLSGTSTDSIDIEIDLNNNTTPEDAATVIIEHLKRNGKLKEEEVLDEY